MFLKMCYSVRAFSVRVAGVWGERLPFFWGGNGNEHSHAAAAWRVGLWTDSSCRRHAACGLDRWLTRMSSRRAGRGEVSWESLASLAFENALWQSRSLERPLVFSRGQEAALLLVEGGLPHTVAELRWLLWRLVPITNHWWRV